MPRFYLLIVLLLLLSCGEDKKTAAEKKENSIELNDEEANRLARLPLKCLLQEYPNKLGQVLNDSSEVKEPSALHPIFYGCFDWHSSVHGHWLLVVLAKKFPQLEHRDSIMNLLDSQFTQSKVEQEMAFFKTKYNESFERTYGWAWLLKLQQELRSWKNPQAQKWADNLQPYANMIADKFVVFLPKLRYPIRSGEHINTAFGLSMAYDYALQEKERDLQLAIEKRAKEFYLKDQNCALNYEPSGYDFLSPALQEVDLLRKILPKEQFQNWLQKFLPALEKRDFSLAVGEVSDRTDGKLVHLDGLNFSRAWCLYALADSDKKYAHLRKIADLHLQHSLPSVVDGDYMGEHWLASFAVYALLAKGEK